MREDGMGWGSVRRSGRKFDSLSAFTVSGVTLSELESDIVESDCWFTLISSMMSSVIALRVRRG